MVWSMIQTALTCILYLYILNENILFTSATSKCRQLDIKSKKNTRLH